MFLQSTRKKPILPILLFLSLLMYSLQQTCTEQWTEIDLGQKTLWKAIDDVSITDDNILFYRDPTITTPSEVGGAIWSYTNFSNKKGVQISFTPTIEPDDTFYGNFKYPQGFAIVFTSSNVNDVLKGSKGSGIGYDGINIAVAFEFDFVQQKDKSDVKSPHFSVHYNLTGPISSASPDKCTICNKALPNFYDPSKDDHIKNVKFTISVFGGELNVTTNTGDKIITNAKFSYLEELFENSEVYIGITSSMNLYKKVLIKDFVVAEISESGQGKLAGNTIYEAGKDISVQYSSLSTCGKALKIYPQQYDKINLLINGKDYTIASKTFVSSGMYLDISFNNVTNAGTYSVIVSLNGDLSNVHKLTINPGSIQRIDLCEDTTYDPDTFVINSNVETNSKYFKVTVCSYDQYKNPKSIYSGYLNLISVDYPSKYIPDLQMVVNQKDNSYKSFTFQIPVSSHGSYTLYSNYFFYNNQRHYTINQSVSNTNSVCLLNKLDQRASVNEQISIELKVKDQFGEYIDKDYLTGTDSTETKRLECTFTQSKVSILSGGVETTDTIKVDTSGEFVKLLYTPTKAAKYTITPFIKCKGDTNAYELCSSKVFYVVSKTVDTTRVKVYSDFYNKSYFNTDLNNGNYLYLSLEENNNKKLTTISFVDQSGIDMALKGITASDTITVSISDSNSSIKLKGVPNLAGFIDIFIDETGDIKRTDYFDQFTTYTLSVSINSANFKTSSPISIPMKFIYKNNLLNNIDLFNTQSEGLIVFNELKSSTVEASKSVALFSIRDKTSKGFTDATNIDTSKIKVDAIVGSSSVPLTTIIDSIYGYVLVSVELLTKGKYTIALKYNSNIISQIDLTVTAKDEVTAFSYHKEDTKIQSEDTNSVTLKTVDTSSIVSFTLTMKDEFGNDIVAKSRDLFNGLKITSSYFKAKIGYNGVIYLVDDTHSTGQHSIVLTTPSGTSFTVYVTKQATISSIDPTKSVVSIDYSSTSTLTLGKDINVLVSLKDSYDNSISLSDEDMTNFNKEFSIYAISTDSKQLFVEFTYSQTTKSYTSKITIAGEYVIKAFYKNIPMKCTGCNFVLSPLSADAGHTRGYIIDNKVTLPLFTSVNQRQYINNNNEFRFYLVHRDQYDNEVSSTTKYNFKIGNANSASLVSLCGDSFYYVCEPEEFKSLQPGEYFIKSGTLTFYIYISNVDYGTQSAISSTKSMLGSIDTYLQATADSVTSFIIDLRDDTFNRINPSNIDLNKLNVIDIDHELDYHFVFGPIKGLITVFANFKDSGTNTINIKYDGMNVFTDPIPVMVSNGRAEYLSVKEKTATHFGDYSFITLDCKSGNDKLCGDQRLYAFEYKEFLLEVKKYNSKTPVYVDKYFNQLTSVVTLRFDKTLLGKYQITSSIISVDATIDITTPSLDQNNFLVYFDGDKTTMDKSEKAKLNVVAVNGHYDHLTISEVSSLIKDRMKATIIRTEEDNVEYIKDVDVTVADSEIYFDISFDKKGDYLAIVHYDSVEIPCQGCRMKVTSSSSTISSYVTYIKSGDEYIEVNENVDFAMYKSTLPFFKVKVYDENKAKIIPSSSQMKFDLVSSSTSIANNQYITKDGDIYIYLTENGKTTYNSLSPLSTITLKATANSKESTLSKLFIMNSYSSIKETVSCPKDATPTVITPSFALWNIIRVDGELVVEFELKGCDAQINDYYYDGFTVLPQTITTNVIPADIKGHYILFAKSSSLLSQKAITIKFKDSDFSEPILLSVIPSYQIATITLGNVDSTFDNHSRFAYFTITPKDQNGNIITGEHNNMFTNDVFVSVSYKGTKLPYQISYSIEKNAFIGQIPLKGNGDYVVSSPLATQSLTVKVNYVDWYFNSYVTMTKNNNQYTATINLLDIDGEPIEDTSIDYKKEFTFSYITVDENTGATYSEDFNGVQSTTKKNQFTITIPTDIIMYQTYSIITFNGDYTTTCENCMYTNDNNVKSIIYEIKGNKKYLIDNSKQLIVEHSIEYPILYVDSYEPSITVEASSSYKLGTKSFTFQTHSSSIKKIITIIGYTDSSMVSQSISNSDITLSIKSTNTKTLSLKVYQTLSLSSSSVAATNVVVHSQKVYNFLSGDKIVMFIEARDADNHLTSATLGIKTSSYTLTTTKSSVTGVYYAEMPITKLADETNIEIKMNNGDSTNNVIYLFGNAAFPQSISITNVDTETWERKKMSVQSYDSNGNAVCDERLNVILTASDFSGASFDIETDEKGCALSVLFTGNAVITSTISKDLSLKLSNFEKVDMNAYTSSLSMTPNVIHDESTLSFSFVVKAKNGMSFPSTATITNMKLNVYQIESSTKRTLVQDIKGLYDLSYTFVPSQLKMYKGNSYVLVGLVDDIQFTNIITAKYESSYSSLATKFSLNIEVDNIKTDISSSLVTLSQVSDTNTRYALSYPYTLYLSVLNANGDKLDITGKISTALVVDDNSDVVSFTYKTIKISDSEYRIEVEGNDYDAYIHLPKKKYYIKFSYSTSDGKTDINYALQITFNDGIRQNTNIDSKYQYALSTEAFPSSFNIIMESGDTTFIGYENTFTRSTVCFYDNTNNKIYNNYIDVSKITFDNTLYSCENSISLTYRGCADLYFKCAYGQTYKGKLIYKETSSTSDINMSVNPEMPPSRASITTHFADTLIDGNELSSTFTLYNSAGKEFNNVDKSKFKIFVDDIPVDGSLNAYYQSKMINLKIQSSAFTYPPKTQTIRVFLSYGDNELYEITDLKQTLSFVQKEFTKGVLSVPVGYQAGNELAMILFLKDKNGYCYNGDVTISDFNVVINKALPGDINLSSFNIVKMTIENFIKCETAFEIKINTTGPIEDNFLTRVGSFVAIVNHGSDQLTSSTLKVYAGNLSQSVSSLQIIGQSQVQTGEMKAGEEAVLSLQGKDAQGNAIDFYDIAEHFRIDFEGLTQGETYLAEIKPNDDNTELRIKLTINKVGTFELQLYLNNVKFENAIGLKRITVKPGECSLNKANVQIDSDSYYPGEKASLSISCTDKLGNPITTQGTEDFSIVVVGKNLEVVGEDTLKIKPTFEDKKYNAKIMLSYTGEYTVNVFLNGKNYGGDNKITVTESTCSGEKKYMCPNKKCVSDFSQCTLSSICTEDDIKAGKSFTCYKDGVLSCVKSQDECQCKDSLSAGRFYPCKVNGIEQCLTAGELNRCDCPQGMEKWNGMCLPESYVYKKYPIKSNCASLAKILYNKDVTQCDDGSCRISGDCDTEMACPAGYVSCGPTCIEFGKTCKIAENVCTSSQIRCWDLSCASSYDKCPTRKSCSSKDGLVCNDGTCVYPTGTIQSICNQPQKCEDNQILCPDLSCKDSIENCATKPICPIGMSLCTDNTCKESCEETKKCADNEVLCSNGQCASNSQFCPTEMFCPSSYVKCPQGGCARTSNECSYLQGTSSLSCPTSTPILCPDLKCVSKSSECASVPSCPPNTPYQCWNNECRKTLSECPTQITCPADSPVLCSNGFCQKSSIHCTNTDTQTCSSTSVRCFDGSCVSSISLCPTHSTCGKDLIKCWNGSCVQKVSECPSTSMTGCSSDSPFRCSDGSCRAAKDSCSTVSVCPVDRPVKCYDNSCRSSLDACPEYHSCGKNMKSCPDGTCASSYEECNTIVSCYFSKPFLCYDNSCKEDLRDCPAPPTCEGKFLCPNGLCVSNRQNCKIFDPCPSTNPVRCASNNCAKTVADCGETNDECPSGYVKCTHGGCQISEAYCEDFTCPPNKPYMCPEGVCALSEDYCDRDNGCPYTLPTKCSNGQCVANESECVTSDTLCKDKVLCPDGSCADNSESCPLVNGCSTEKPQKCADGTCINPKTTSCSKVLCSFDSPIQCPNGQCVKTASECPAAAKVSDTKDCAEIGKEGYFMCADGRCVPSSDFCRPLFSCDNNYYKCYDGTCRVSQSLCPEAMNCPKNRPYRCDNVGLCVLTQDDCKSTICPKDYTRCDTTGECLAEGQTCDGLPKTQSGCPEETPYKCSDGRCMSTKESCQTVNIACSESTPYLCPNGICKETQEDCDKTECGIGYTLCSNGKCVEKGKENEQCANDSGCLPNTPFRCANGVCVSDASKCPATVACDANKPYVCADKSCVADSKECKVLYPCGEGYTRCDNGYCAKDASQCEASGVLCPIASPIKCPTGKCVSDYTECSQSFIAPTCEDGEFYCVRQAKCVSSAKECVGESNAKGQSSSSRRRLQTAIENGCTSENPYSCYDGTCVNDRKKCPVLPACKVMEYRCPNGSCQKDKSKCETNNVECENGLNKCEDGLCRATCPAFNGCSIGQFQCTNGMCVKDELECIGYSMCSDSSAPYRCMDGKCVSSPSSCVSIKRINSVKPISYSFGFYDKVSFNFAYDTTNREIAKLEIPSNSLESTKSKIQGTIKIEEVAHSDLYDTKYYNNTAEFLYNVSNGIIGSDGILGFENAILSPIVKISSDDIKTNFTIPALLTLEFNMYTQSEDSFNVSDYCLAQFDESATEPKWECVVRCEKEEQNQFNISSLGTYAIYLNPVRHSAVVSSEQSKNFFLDNIKAIAIVLGSVIITSAIVFYIFTRIIRYREKYHANLEKINLLQQQRQEYELMTTDVFGQTLGDNILGLVYTKNCFYSVEEKQKQEGNETLEDDVEELQRQCHNVEKQNQRLQENIDSMTEQYKALAFEIDSMKH